MNKIDFSHEQYLPIEELGRGGMGVVYRCTDRKMLNDVAVKVIGWNLSDNEVIRFHTEAKALAKLQHPYILSILHFGHSDNDSLFLVTELLTGRSLSSVIENGIVPPFEDALTIFIQICDGLAHAHRRDILHRDIKPSNIFVERTARGDIRTTITDFGLAKLLTEDQRQTKTGITLGSPAYMSPEQAAGKSVDERSDIYSVGCLMFEVLAGQKPFDAPTVPSVIMKQINEPAPPLSAVAADRNYPDETEQILAKCLKKNPDERYAHVTELRDALQQLKEDSASTFAQYNSSSTQSGSAAKMDEFLMTGIQQKSKIPVARKTAIGVTVLVIIGIMGCLVWNESTAPIDHSISPKAASTTPGAKQASYEESLLQERADNRTFSKTEPAWVNCKSAGGGVKLVDLATQAGKTPRIEGSAPYYIDCRESDLTEAQLSSIASFELLGLRLNNTKIGNDALKNTISKIKTLEDLQIPGTNVSDAGVKHLAGNNQLKVINLSETGITDESVPTLSKLKSIKFLCLMDCPKLTGSTFGALQKSQKLDSLSLGGSNIDTANLKLLKKIPLTYLDVQRLDLTDKDLAVIEEFETLTHLILYGNQKITSDGLMKLTKLKNLVVLGLHDCPKVSLKAITEFRRQLPKLVVQVPTSKSTGNSPNAKHDIDAMEW